MNPIPIFDAHLHTAGTFLNHNGNICDYMDAHNVRKAVITTINRAANPKTVTGENAGESGTANDSFEKAVRNMSNGQLDHGDVDAAAQKFPDRFVKFFWFNPGAGTTDGQTDFQVLATHFKQGYSGVKIHSGLHLVKIPDDIMDLAAFMQETDSRLPLYIHSTPAFSLFRGIQGKDFLELARRFPDLRIMIGHAGFAMEYAIELGYLLKKCENVFFETSCSTPYAILSLIKMAGHNRVLFGSDAPITNPLQMEIEKIMVLPISDEHKRDILYRNTDNLLFGRNGTDHG